MSEAFIVGTAGGVGAGADTPSLAARAAGIPLERVDEAIWSGDCGCLPASLPLTTLAPGMLAGHAAVHAAARAVLAGDAALALAGASDLDPAEPDPHLEWAEWSVARYAGRVASAFHLSPDTLLGYANESRRRAGLNPLDPPPTTARPAAGAAALVLASPKAVGRYNLAPSALVLARAAAVSDATGQPGSIPAAALALKMAGLALDAVDLILIDEAAAALPLAWLASSQADPARLNPAAGALAGAGAALARGRLPTAEGALLVAELASRLAETGGKYGLALSAAPSGLGLATLLERV